VDSLPSDTYRDHHAMVLSREKVCLERHFGSAYRDHKARVLCRQGAAAGELKRAPKTSIAVGAN
jgi:hypothetical protein